MNAAAFASIRLLLFTIIYLGTTISFCFAGICWSTMIKNHNGRCSEILHEKISKEDCCSQTTSVSTAWSAEDLDSSTLFFWRMLGGGVPCAPCKNSCTNIRCETDRKCVVRKGIPKCICSQSCKDNNNNHHMINSTNNHNNNNNKNKKKQQKKGAVCGSDGRTYKNSCRLKKKACKQRLHNNHLSVAYYGLCQSSCDKINCSNGKTCLLDQNLTPHCVHCPKRKCSNNVSSTIISKHRYVCGANGLTYKSTCHLREAACMGGRGIPIAHKGTCKATTVF